MGKQKESKRCKHHSSSKNDDEKKFLSILALEGLRVQEQLSDGNCLFRSIADQVYNDANKHFELRELTISYMKQHEEYFKLFIEDDEPFDDYVRKMNIDGEWGGNQEIYAMSQALKMDIVVHQVDGPNLIIKYDNIDNKSKSHAIHISFHGECHYNSIRRIDDNNDKPAIHFHIHGSMKAKDLVKDVMKAVPWLTARHAEIALDMNSYDVNLAIDLLMTNSDTITEIINNNNYNDNNDNDKNTNNTNNIMKNDIKSKKQITNDRSKPIVLNKIKAMSKKEERKLKKKTTKDDAAFERSRKGTDDSNDNDINDSLSKAINEIYL